MAKMKSSFPPQFGSILLMDTNIENGYTSKSCQVIFDDKPYLYLKKLDSKRPEIIGEYNLDFFQQNGHEAAVQGKDKNKLLKLLEAPSSSLARVLNPKNTYNSENDSYQESLHTVLYRKTRSGWLLNLLFPKRRVKGIPKSERIKIKTNYYGQHELTLLNVNQKEPKELNAQLELMTRWSSNIQSLIENDQMGALSLNANGFTLGNESDLPQAPPSFTFRPPGRGGHPVFSTVRAK